MKTEELAGLLESIRIAPMRPDDVLVLKIEAVISEEIAERIREHLRKFLGADRKILVLSNGTDIEIVRPDSA